MPLLKRPARQLPDASPEAELTPGPSHDSDGPSRSLFYPTLIGECANPGCRSGWLHLFRRRSTPGFEGGWTCSPECTEARIAMAIRRELDGGALAGEIHHHRIPLGLLMLEQGWITGRQLHDALAAQKANGAGRLGEWLIRLQATDETAVTRALGLQWSCPVLCPEVHSPEDLASWMPRLFLDAFGALPLRVAADRILYLGFEQSLDPVLAFAVGRMLGLRVESAIVPSSLFRPAMDCMLKAKFPGLQLAEAVSEKAAAHLLARCVERQQPVQSRLVRVHDLVWLRMWLSRHVNRQPCTDLVSDVVCSIGTF